MRVRPLFANLVTYNTQLFNILIYNTIVLYVLLSHTFQQAVKLVELISKLLQHCSNVKFNKINKLCVLATCATRNSIYLINLVTKEEPFSDKY